MRTIERLCKTCRDELDADYSFAICPACTEERQATAVSTQRAREREALKSPEFQALVSKLKAEIAADPLIRRIAGQMDVDYFFNTQRLRRRRRSL